MNAPTTKNEMRRRHVHIFLSILRSITWPVSEPSSPVSAWASLCQFTILSINSLFLVMS